MKKIFAFVLMAAMLLSLTACAKQPAEEGAAAETVEIASALELLNNVWAQYADDEKFSAGCLAQAVRDSSMAAISTKANIFFIPFSSNIRFILVISGYNGYSAPFPPVYKRPKPLLGCILL